MLKNILLGIIGCILLLPGCSKDEDEDVHRTENITDWFEVKDKPGELNQLLYRIYKEHGLTIFVNDTLGQEMRGVDAYGNPIIHTESFDAGYYIFGTYEDVDSIRLSSDTAAMIKAVKVIEEKVIPYLPKSGQYRPHSLLLAHALDMVCDAGSWSSHYIYYTQNTYFRSLKGVICGELKSLQTMTEEELSMWAGNIVVAKFVEGIIENYETEINEFYDITDEDEDSGTNYDWKLSVYDEAIQYPCEEFGFLNWKCKDDSYTVTVSKTEDVQNFAAVVYAYKGREGEFLTKYQEYDKVLRKFEIMKNILEKFENSLP